MRKLKVKEKKESKIKNAYIVVVGSFNTLGPCLLPLANFFNFDFSFLILPDVLSDNIPIFFL